MTVVIPHVRPTTIQKDGRVFMNKVTNIAYNWVSQVMFGIFECRLWKKYKREWKWPSHKGVMVDLPPPRPIDMPWLPNHILCHPAIPLAIQPLDRAKYTPHLILHAWHDELNATSRCSHVDDTSRTKRQPCYWSSSWIREVSDKRNIYSMAKEEAHIQSNGYRRNMPNNR